MTKSLLTGLAVCTALAMFAGNASAERARTQTMKPTPTVSTISSWTAKGGPLHDCVHVAFPQCDRGYPGVPND
jgi:hypothetical protein